MVAACNNAETVVGPSIASAKPCMKSQIARILQNAAIKKPKPK